MGVNVTLVTGRVSELLAIAQIAAWINPKCGGRRKCSTDATSSSEAFRVLHAINYRGFGSARWGLL